MFSKLTDKLNEYLEMGIPFYDCMVMKNGKCVYRHMGGYLDKENQIRPTGKEMYHIYSCSKLITCTAALQLWEKGLFKLDDELCRYMPEFETMYVKTSEGLKKAENKITIRHLFTMTAGFSYDLCSPQLEQCKKETEGRCQMQEVMRYLVKEPLLFEPGYRWQYSLCHDVLAALVELLSGKKFSEYVRENIFEPCKMEHSTFAVTEKVRKELCPHYRYNEENREIEWCEKQNAFKLGAEYESGGAGCVSTVEDYMKFLEAIRTYRLLKKDTIDLLATNQLTQEQRNMETYWVRDRRGYGLGQQCPAEDNPRTDFGWGGAAGAHYFVDRENGITAYLGTQVLGLAKYQNARGELTEIIQEILK